MKEQPTYAVVAGGRTTRTKPDECPNCFGLITAATSRHEAKPQPEDLNVCAYCGQILKYGPDLELVFLAEDELAALPADLRTEAEAMSAAIKSAHKLVGMNKGPDHMFVVVGPPQKKQ